MLISFFFVILLCVLLCYLPLLCVCVLSCVCVCYHVCVCVYHGHVCVSVCAHVSSQWLDDVNSKVMLSTEQPVPVLLLANKVSLKGNNLLSLNNLRRYILMNVIHLSICSSCVYIIPMCDLFQCDIDEATVDREMVDSFCKQHNFIGWFPTSAKSNTNIGELWVWEASMLTSYN